MSGGQFVLASEASEPYTELLCSFIYLAPCWSTRSAAFGERCPGSEIPFTNVVVAVSNIFGLEKPVGKGRNLLSLQELPHEEKGIYHG